MTRANKASGNNEVVQLARDGEETCGQLNTESPAYPPQDRGSGAWLFLFGACIIEIAAWGFPYCYGVFESYFVSHPPFQGKSVVSVGGVLCNGVLQLSLPLVIYYVNNFPAQRKLVMWSGCILCTISAIGAGFARTPAQLITCIGLLYGVGAGMLFGPSMHFMSEWFCARRSLAYGFICASGTAAGAALPPIYTICLDKYGYRVTLIGWGLVTFIITSLGLLCVHPRVPVTVVPSPSRDDFNFVKRPLFFVILTATIFQAIAQYGPILYLPTFGTQFALTSTQGALLVSLLNLAQAVGQPLQGMLADWRKSFYIPMLISTIGAGLEILLIWGFARNLWSLAIFAIAFGCTAGGFAVLRPRFASAIIGNQHESNQQSLLVFSILTSSRGTAIISSGFIMTVLIHTERSETGWGGGQAWSQLLIYCGTAMLLASLGAMGKFLPQTQTVVASAEENFSKETERSKGEGLETKLEPSV